ncbi:MAG: hypothetical protein K6E78_02715 [Treponema sp.]|nr:hypothetical protein [Treponema sp.]
MKKVLSTLFLSFFLFSFISCVNNSSSTNTPDNPEPQPTPETKDSNVIIKNNSQYDVNIYVEKSPYYNVEPDFNVKANSSFKCKLPVSEDTVGTVFYIEYLIDIGNAKFTYRTLETQGYQYLLIKENSQAELTIAPLEKCESNAAYFYIENQTASSIYLINGIHYVNASGTKEYNVPAKGAAVYEINGTTTAISFGNYSQLKIVSGNEEYKLPVSESDVQKGNVYSFVLATDSSSGTAVTKLSLKSITPFNIDTQKKIWSRYSKSSSDIDISAVRPMKNLSEGYLAACSSKSYPYAVIMKKINAYGQTVDSRNVGIEEDGSGNKVLSISCQDFMEAADGSCVMLCKLTVRPKTYEDENGQIQNVTESDGDTFDLDEWFLWKYNFTTARLDFSLNLSSSLQKNGEALVDFSNGSQNILIELSDGVYALAGLSVSFDSEENQIINELLLKYDSDSKNLSIKKPYSATLIATDEAGENLVICGASSLFYSKKDDCIYASDFYNWYTAYDAPSGEPQYISRVRKYDTDLNLVETVCQQENALYLAINGDSVSGKYYVCGEVCESGKILKGLLISSANIKDGSVSKSYSYKTDNYPFAWFSNVCICGSNIVASGHAASKRDSQDLPVVVSFSPDGDLQWENTAYTNYKSAPSCFATSIGTYLIHLKGVNSNGQEYSSIVSADLLGNDTGNTAELK